MVKVIISNQHRVQLVQLQQAANTTYRKALNSQGYCTFDLPLSDPYCTPQYLNAANFVHVYGDADPSTTFATAQWGGVLTNDFEVKPKEGIVTVSAAGMGNLLETSIVSNTVTFSGIDAGSAMSYLITTCDNYAWLQTVGLQAYTLDTSGPVMQGEQYSWGDPVLDDCYKISQDYDMDLDVRPDLSYGILTRLGYDRPNLVVRYGDKGNVQVDSTMRLVNTELANQVYMLDLSTGNSVYTASQTSVTYYGPKSLVIQDDGTWNAYDALTKAQLYALKAAFPLYMLDNVSVVDSSLLPYYMLNVGDRILFESPALPMLASFQGMQRILALEYNDRKRLMTLTLGNALYKVIKNRIAEVRLY